MTNPMNVRVDADLDARVWLRAHGYRDVAQRIDTIMEGWKFAGKRTRRDWWLVLAGTPLGKARSVDGHAFPVLKAARRRQGFPPDVPNAIERGHHELAPAIKRQERWGKGFKRVLK